MRKSCYFILIIIFCIALPISSIAQDLGFTYQAVAVDRSKSEGFGLDSQGEILANTDVNLRFSIREGSDDGPIVYQELHASQTDIFGIFRLVIGRGQNILGNELTALGWGNRPYFLEVEIDMGSGYEFLGVEELMGSPYSLNQASNQNLDLTGDQLSISGGNSITLQDVDPTNELQDIITDGSPGNLEMSSGSVISLNVDDADADSSNEIQTLSITGNDLTLSDGGGTITLPSSSENTTDELQTISRTDLDITLSDGGGTVSVADDDPDPSNEIQDLQLVGDILTITNNGSPTSIDLSPYNAVAFATAGGITSNSPGALDTDDFVFGSDSLDDQPGTTDNSRIYFDKSKGAFRAGVADGDQWDDANVGIQSVAMGYNASAPGYLAVALGWAASASGSGSFSAGSLTNASGIYSTSMGVGSEASGIGSAALGENTLASGRSSFAIGFSTSAEEDYSFAGGLGSEATGEFSFAFGSNSLASGVGSVAIGEQTSATGIWSTSIGSSTRANGNYSFAGGRNTEASGDVSFAFGVQSLASGNRSIAIGNGANARGAYSTALGSTDADGWSSLTAGAGTSAPSYAEIALGSWNTTYIPNSFADVNVNDRLLVLGNGGGVTTRSNALIVYKSGDATLYGTLTEVSDRRLKNEIASIENSSERLTRLRGVNFKWNNVKPHNTESLQTGFVAQEVEKVFPELVHEDYEGYKSVNYIGLIPHLVETIKELNRENEELQQEIDELRQQGQSILQELDRISSKIGNSKGI